MEMEFYHLGGLCPLLLSERMGTAVGLGQDFCSWCCVCVCVRVRSGELFSKPSVAALDRNPISQSLNKWRNGGPLACWRQPTWVIGQPQIWQPLCHHRVEERGEAGMGIPGPWELGTRACLCLLPSCPRPFPWVGPPPPRMLHLLP